MPTLELKPTHKPVKAYYATLAQFNRLGVTHETAVRGAFQGLLETCAGQRRWTVVPEWEIKRANQNPLRVDGALIDEFKIPHGFWEAKDSQDDLTKEAHKKFDLGYPQDNILFQAPNRALLFQDRQLVLDADLTQPDRLIAALTEFFAYTPPAFEEWETAVTEFQQRVPELGAGLKAIIDAERKTNTQFVTAFTDFAGVCRASLNPNLRDEAVEEMLIQHLLTERLFRTVFKNPDFVKRNAIASQIERVIEALTARSFSRAEFLGKLDRFYRAIENTAETITDFSQKQKFLNTVYEKFFQGFSVKVADTHGIVYTPPPIVRFMVASVEYLLKKHFGKSLASPGVHILDPFAGTDNFPVHLLPHIPKTALRHKYAHELWTNEIMLLPYYVGCMNLEHAYYEATGEYLAFSGACLVDTFETAETTQHEFGFMSHENVERVKRQKAAPIFVVLSNPPYNAWQTNENDNNKNRKYKVVDGWVADTYAKDSRASNKNSLSDPYIKAFCFASRRIGDEGIVAFVTNNGFLDGIACDGMRKHLVQAFDEVYVLDLTGNVRKNPKLSGTTHNVFGIQVGVSITFLVRTKKGKRPGKVFYARTDEFWRKEQKYRFLDDQQDAGKVKWKQMKPDKNDNWLTEGMSEDFESFLPLGSKEGASETIFATMSNGVKTNRDAWTWNFDRAALVANTQRMIETYNEHLFRWQRRKGSKQGVDDFVTYDNRISWSESLKNRIKRGAAIEFNEPSVRRALYRPFVAQHLYFDSDLAERRYQFPSIYPTAATEQENRAICLSDAGSRSPFSTLAVGQIPEVHLIASSDAFQCFPYYTYAADGTGRRENVTDWALAQFQEKYGDATITKWDIFHYIYAVLHHQQYREKYAANLRRELPRIPFVGCSGGLRPPKSAKNRRSQTDATVFRQFVAAGKRLAELHVGYEQQAEYPLQKIEAKDAPLDWRVEKVKLAKDKASLRYNDFLTLAGIPKEAFDYRLGNRSALDWVIDQYQVSTDKRSGITNDPNRPDDEQYIARLIGQVITVSVETAKIVKALPPLK